MSLLFVANNLVLVMAADRVYKEKCVIACTLFFRYICPFHHEAEGGSPIITICTGCEPESC